MNKAKPDTDTREEGAENAEAPKVHDMSAWFIYASWIIFFVLFSARTEWVMCTDIAWLMTAAERVLDGLGYVDGFYEPNPPMAILIEIIPVLLSNITGMAWDMSQLVFVFGVIGFCGLLTWKILQVMAPDARARSFCGFMVAAFVYITAAFVMDQNFGQREHLIFIMLTPYILATLSRTSGLQIPQKLWLAAVILCGFGALLKPHYVLVPVFLWVHRFIRTRDLMTGFNSDFTIPAGMTAAYLGLTYAMFPDYYSVILPDVVDFYWGFREAGWRKMVNFAFPPFALMMACAALLEYPRGIKTTRAEDLAADGILISGLAFLLIGILQMKGFHYHALPAWFCAGMMAAMVLYVYGRHMRASKDHYIRNLMLFLGAMLFLGVVPMRFLHVTVDEYRQMKLFRIVAEEAEGSSYALLSTEIFPPFMVYMHDVDYSGRVHNVWPLHKYKNMMDAGVETDRMEELRSRIASWIAQDLNTDKPAVVLVETGSSKLFIDKDNPDSKPLDILALFSLSEDFVTAWAPYAPLLNDAGEAIVIDGHYIYRRQD